MNDETPFDALFSGIMGEDYAVLKLICPLAAEMSRLVGIAVGGCSAKTGINLNVVELGGGTGITTLAILISGKNLTVTSVDNEPTMQNQAKKHLKEWFDKDLLRFSGDDALTALNKIQTDSVDIVATAYTLHNFEKTYRKQVIDEVFRALKPGGQFINGDRYALDDTFEHTRAVQKEISRYFKILTKENKLDLLEHWIVHLFNDESVNHVMRENDALTQLKAAGFIEVGLYHRMEVNALVTASKPY